MEKIENDEKKLKSRRASKVGGTLFVGLFFIGWSLGMLMGKPHVGMFMGMGAGFVAMALCFYAIKD